MEEKKRIFQSRETIGKNKGSFLIDALIFQTKKALDWIVSLFFFPLFILNSKFVLYSFVFQTIGSNSPCLKIPTHHPIHPSIPSISFLFAASQSRQSSSTAPTTTTTATVNCRPIHARQCDVRIENSTTEVF